MVAELFTLNLAFRGLSDEDNTDDVATDDADDLEEDDDADDADKAEDEPEADSTLAE